MSPRLTIGAWPYDEAQAAGSQITRTLLRLAAFAFG